MSEQIDLDRDDDNAEDALQAQWLEAEGKRMARKRRKQYFDITAGFVVGVVILILICAIISGGMR